MIQSPGLQHQADLKAQARGVDAGTLALMRQELEQSSTPSTQDIRPLSTLVDAASVCDLSCGIEALRAGKIACLIVAGGQGSRLGFEGPKGAFEVSPSGKSLFQLSVEKVLAASHWADYPLELAVMTSPANHSQTVAFFEKHDYWGLPSNRLQFFTQGTQPILDEEGQLFLDADGQLACGPDGNGTALQALYQSGIWERWQERGVEWIQWLLVDNPLAQPFDTKLASFHSEGGWDVVVKCCTRQDPQESVGLLAKVNGRVGVLEYTEVDEALRCARDLQGDLLFNAANISLFSFSMDFVERAAMHYTAQLPWHLAHKAIPFKDLNGTLVKPDAPNAWKFEKFIFDLLSFSERTGVLGYDRADCFAPLKNAEGADSIKTVRAALAAFERRHFPDLAPKHAELDPGDYYPHLLREGC